MRCFFHIRDGETLIRDNEGTDHVSEQAALREAFLSARDLVAEAVRTGRPFFGRSIVIEDETKRIVGCMPFSHVLLPA